MAMTTDIISTKVSTLEEKQSMKAYLGKKVFSKSGDFVGKIHDVIGHNYGVLGVLVHGRQNIFIDREYFATDSEDAVMLSINPVISIIGKQVFDSDGRRLGKVIGIDRKNNSNNFRFFIVKKNVFSKPFLVPKEDIDVFKKNVILKKSYQNEKDNNE